MAVIRGYKSHGQRVPSYPLSTHFPTKNHNVSRRCVFFFTSGRLFLTRVTGLLLWVPFSAKWAFWVGGGCLGPREKSPLSPAGKTGENSPVDDARTIEFTRPGKWGEIPPTTISGPQNAPDQENGGKFPRRQDHRMHPTGKTGEIPPTTMSGPSNAPDRDNGGKFPRRQDHRMHPTGKTEENSPDDRTIECTRPGKRGKIPPTTMSGPSNAPDQENGEKFPRRQDHRMHPTGKTGENSPANYVRTVECTRPGKRREIPPPTGPSNAPFPK
jgi:hypothetical protein